MLRPRSPRVSIALLFAALAGFAPSARAVLYVYEGFNGYTTGALAGQTPNGNTVGLDTAVNYYDDGGNRTSGFSIQSTGLALGSLQTGGGALAFSSGTFVIGADISQTAITGTLWSSYLVNFSTTSATSGNGALVRIGSTPADSGTNTRFTSWADSRNSSANIGVAYSGANGTDGTAGLATGTTYILIGKFTNVGTSLSVGTPGTATLWALTTAQFNAFIAAGGTEAALQPASVTATATQTTTTGTFTFNSNSAFGIVAVGTSGVIDELRYGSTLADVTPVPEPAMAPALAGLSALLAVILRRRRRA